MSTYKRFELLNEEEKRLNVYHLEDMEPYFEDRKNLPSGRIFTTKWGKIAIEGLRMIEEKYDRSWYSCVKEHWQNEDYWTHEMVFYRGTILTAEETFRDADRLAGGMLHCGIQQGDEIGCCVSNHPIVPIIMLAASKIGAKVNFFGSHYNPLFVEQILGEITPKLFIATDDEYKNIVSLVDAADFKNKLIVSLTDYLPEHPEQMEGYEPQLAQFYHYENLVPNFSAKDDKVIAYPEFLEIGAKYADDVIDNNGLDTEFLITYTSGSTKTGFPKRLIHRNRSAIVVGLFHDPKLCGNPSVKNLRGMSHIHTDTNTNLITMISDSFFTRWSVAMEPTYDRELFLDYLFINKPNFVLATTAFWLEAARQYLREGKYSDRDMQWLLATMAVGESCQPGEEKFINRFLKKMKAGHGVPLAGPVKLPWAPIGIGGGDTEHGGIYYTLFKHLKDMGNTLKFKKEAVGMAPVPYAQATVLRQEKDGSFVECGYNEPGIIVANSATTMAGYKNFDRVREKIITDSTGMDWVSCDVYGYIDKDGAIHMKDRRDSKIVTESGESVLPFEIIDTIQEDSDNILTSVLTTTTINEKLWFIVNFQISPFAKHSRERILKEMDQRLSEKFPNIYNRIVYREFTEENPFPCAASGKRNMSAVDGMGNKDLKYYKDGVLYSIEK